jgi:hypothetical protein
MNSRLEHPIRALQVALGLTATLAGLDKFFNILAHWSAYISPFASRTLPVSAGTFLDVVGIIEVAVGIAILWAAPRIGAYAASAWLLLVAINLVFAGYFDIAVRDVVMSLAAFTLARAFEAREQMAATSMSASSRRTAIASVVMFATVLAGGRLASAMPVEISQQHVSTAHSSPAVMLRENMRKLWTDHVVWTRGYIVAAVAGTPDAQAAATRLMKNQEDIGAAVASVYGTDAGAKLTALLKEHISIAVDIIKFAKAGDKTAQKEADTKWHRNGEAIADFLSKANPHWPRATLVEMMNEHLATTTDEVVARLTRNWDADVRAFDRVYAHILTMSDALADGIVAQFPDRFGEATAHR